MFRTTCFRVSFAVLSAAVALLAAAETVPEFPALLQGEKAFQHGDLAEAERIFQQACPSPVTDVTNATVLRGLCLNDFALLQQSRNDFAGAEAYYQRSVEIWAKLPVSFRSHQASALANLSGLYQLLGRWNDAEKTIAHALELQRESSGDTHLRTGQIMARYGGILVGAGKLAEAEPLLKQALSIQKAAAPNSATPELALTLNNLATLHANLGEYDQSFKLLYEAVEIVRQTAGERQDLYGMALANLGSQYAIAGKDERAIPLLLRAQGILEATLGADHPRVGMLLNQRAILELHRGKTAAALAMLQQSRRILEPHFAPDSLELAVVDNHLGLAYLHQGDLAKADELMTRALKVKTQFYARPHRETAMILFNMAELRLRQHRFSEAEEYRRQFTDMYTKALGLGHPDLGRALQQYAKVMRDEGGQKSAARDAEKQAKSILGFR